MSNNESSLDTHAHESDIDPCIAVIDGHYDIPLHIAAIFIIMAISFLGTLLPIVFKHFATSKTGRSTITALKLFGAGVILATALVHMFVPATQVLTNECLPLAFHQYEAFSAVFAIIGIFLTHIVQVFAGHAIKNHQKKALFSLDKAAIDSAGQISMPLSNETHHEGHTHGGALMRLSEKQLMVYLLELGIASHSIIIGVTLGIVTDEFKTLLIALCFHQFFEGLALSAIVVEADFKKWTMSAPMVLFYTLTTPIGITIGILVREFYNANGTSTLLSTGILDAVSAGILAYDALVNVIYPHFSAESFNNESPMMKATQLCTMYAGCAAMSVIGLWA
ncbi:hypothetical protein BASA50_008587 [Batrachochytrium salamandrivorans]|uniref:Zinc/iron permease n=1 Tax=Batrachochytrium salamandrivorans TaxID=1357716 RepID=A0ABQ8F3Q5_9FUNG|nr:hypothetical protein BASA60_010258 [Batrachochytrium salamandrivorans]KAH6591613.1 hypothetical protein BASA50_008587 [Batrachochytrium salamandrivorans]KAH6597297.1 hypothetical protein BASA61_003192 [Batrachochytrium salamandrivorans]